MIARVPEGVRVGVTGLGAYALAEACAAVLMTAGGAGLTWGSLLVRWSENGGAGR